MKYIDLPQKIRTWFEEHNIDKRGMYILPNGDKYHLFKFDDYYYQPVRELVISSCIFEISITLDVINNTFQYEFGNKLDSNGKLIKMLGYSFKVEGITDAEIDECIVMLEKSLIDFNTIYNHYLYLDKHCETCRCPKGQDLT